MFLVHYYTGTGLGGGSHRVVHMARGGRGGGKGKKGGGNGWCEGFGHGGCKESYVW
jgi:hypothetical protein